MVHDLSPPAYPRPRYAYYVTFVLLLAYSVSYVDRQILSLMVEPIKADLRINDTELSLLHGFAFALFYTTLGLVFGRLADRGDRRNLMIGGVIVWSLATAAGGLATGFLTLFLARLFVGVGEASLSPSAYSMLADYFRPERRARALSIYSLGVYLGSALAFIVGGWVVQATHGPGAWKTAFFMVSLPGVLVTALLLTVREPVRRIEAPALRIDAAALPVDLSYLKARKAVYAPLILGYSTLSIVTLGLMAWVPTVFIRTWHWSPREIGQAYGIVILFFGLAGVALAGFACDFWVAKSRRADAAFLLSLLGSAFLIPLTAGLAFSASASTALALLAAIVFFLGFPIGLAPTVYQSITPNRLRGQVIAFYLLANNVIGMSLGPTAVAFVTNYVFKDDLRVGVSLSLVCSAASVLGVGLLLVSARPYRRLLAR